MSLPEPNPYVRSGPLLGTGWTHVESFDALPDASEGQEGGDSEYEWDSEEEEVSDRVGVARDGHTLMHEQVYVSLDLGSATDPLVIATSAEYQLIGLDSDHPYLKVGNHVFRGQPRQLIGSEIIFKDVRDAENTIKHTHHAIASTQHMIQFEPVKLVPRERARGDVAAAGSSSTRHTVTAMEVDRDDEAVESHGEEDDGEVQAAPSPTPAMSAPAKDAELTAGDASSPAAQEEVELDINGLPVRKKARPGRKAGQKVKKTSTTTRAEIDTEPIRTPTPPPPAELIEGEAGPGPSTLASRDQAEDNVGETDATHDQPPPQTGGDLLSLLGRTPAASSTTPRTRNRGGRGRGRGNSRGGGQGGRTRGTRNRTAQVLLDVEERMRQEEEMAREQGEGNAVDLFVQEGAEHDATAAGQSSSSAVLPPGNDDELPPGLQQMEQSPSPDF